MAYFNEDNVTEQMCIVTHRGHEPYHTNLKQEIIITKGNRRMDLAFEERKVGRRLSGKPTTKGVYINSGRKIVIE